MIIRRALCALATSGVLIGALALAAPTAGSVAAEEPTTTFADRGRYDAPDRSSHTWFEVTGGYGERGSLGLRRETQNGDTRVVETEEWSGLLPTSRQFTMNHVVWTAHLKMTVPTTAQRDTYRFVGGKWKLSRSETMPSTLTEDVTWVGDHSTLRTEGGPVQGHGGYRLCPTWAVVDAVASGSVTSSALGITQPVNNEPGELWHSDDYRDDPFCF